MNGAESLVRTLIQGGVDVCFANPGTSEMHFVGALDAVPGMRCVLALFEGVATGAADGYWRIARKPAATLLHLGPGLANGLANLHNARKAGSGVINIVGEHASTHLALDAPLTADIVGLATPMSHWIRNSTSSLNVAADGAAAVIAARTPPGQVATLILPGDTAWEPGSQPLTPAPPPSSPAVAQIAVDSAVNALARGTRSLLLLGGSALDEETLTLAGRIATATGCGLLSEWSNARLDRGAGRVALARIPYEVDKAVATLRDYDTIVLAGARAPIAFFAYPDKPGILSAPGCEITSLASREQDVHGALAAVADGLGASNSPPLGVAELHRPAPPEGPLTLAAIAAALGALLPEQAIVVDESITSGRNFFAATEGAPPHVWLNNMGGSIGYGLPVAVGASIAAPERKVLALVGDGSAMYTQQALWTMAREALDVTVLIFANHSYRILNFELANVGFHDPGPRALDMFSLERPRIDWVAMASAMGVPASRAGDSDSLVRALGDALAQPGPGLIEVAL